ncbi:hypothetical protein CTAYLR_006212 [Chrysophaeum taylorii]|uniref:Uncharacterized protein n=1 Tax=Chrysophaeum taylorii TaxID=2483200 RepID=A0AAD7U6M2_9STRA|nr:hypothetical protein CTAYLR_006212 [Chrysophaeum taylorii]
MLRRVRNLSTVAEVTVRVTFIDHEGSRAVVPGRVGMTVAAVAEMHEIDIGPVAVGMPKFIQRTPTWAEEVFGEGINLGYDHVQIPPAWLHKLPPPSKQEIDMLKHYWDDEVTDSSRLASQITLNKDLDGIQVYIPDGIPTDGAF